MKNLKKYHFKHMRKFYWKINAGKSELTGFNTKEKAEDALLNLHFPKNAYAEKYEVEECPKCGHLDDITLINEWGHCIKCDHIEEN